MKRQVTFKKEGLGRAMDLGVSMVEALIGGFIFNVFCIDLGFDVSPDMVADALMAADAAGRAWKKGCSRE